MKIQNKYPFDSTLTDLNNIYHTIDDDSFFVNSGCIFATNKIITKGREYIIFGTPSETGIQMVDVILVDSYYREGIISLIVCDIKSKRVFTIDHCIECPESHCTWILVSIRFFIDKMDEKAIQSYCGKCNDLKKKPNAEINSKSSQVSITSANTNPFFHLIGF